MRENWEHLITEKNCVLMSEIGLQLYYIKYPDISFKNEIFEAYQIKCKNYYHYVIGKFTKENKLDDNKRKFQIIYEFDSENHLEIIKLQNIFYNFKLKQYDNI